MDILYIEEDYQHSDEHQIDKQHSVVLYMHPIQLHYQFLSFVTSCLASTSCSRVLFKKLTAPCEMGTVHRKVLQTASTPCLNTRELSAVSSALTWKQKGM